jgi:dolichol-phosphate mannosyltransferase
MKQKLAKETISIVIPIFNEEATIQHLVDRLRPVLDSLHEKTEVLFVDDGSLDRSFELLQKIHQRDRRFKVLQFSRNFGHQVAISAGIDHAIGDAVVLMDGDLQDPPEVLPIFIAKWREGNHVVYAIRRKRKENIFKRTAYALFYRALKKLSYLDIPLDSGDFCLMDRRVVDVVKTLPERNRFVRGLRTWAGFQQVGVEYERDRRFAGDPKYTFAKLIGLAYDGLFSFSTAPLRGAVYIGFFISLCSFLGGLWVVYEKLTNAITIVGWTSTIVIITFFSGIIISTLGLMAEYIRRIYEEVKHRPLYVVRKRVGI